MVKKKQVSSGAEAPNCWAIRNVRAKAQTYLGGRSNGKNKAKNLIS